MKQLSLTVLFSLMIISVLICQRQSLFEYYGSGDRILSPIEQNQYNQLYGSGNYSEINIASVRNLGNIKVGREFDVNFGDVVKTIKEDYLISKENGEYQVTGVFGEDDDDEGYTSFTCTYHIKYGVTGSIMNDITEEYYQIIPITKAEGEDHINPEVFICKWIPNKYIGKNGCSTPAIEPDPEDGDDLNDDEIETRSNCNRNIRVLFLFTNRAAASGFNPATVANTVINELNTSVTASQTNQLTATYENAGAVNIPSFITFTDMGDDLDALVDDPIA
ncbi:MAG: hypothetical protein ACJATI_005620 [Halioglobus sp.]|jgi:hypothetical protein